MNNINMQAALAALAMFCMGGLAAVMVFVAVPDKNHDYITFILGAMSGAMTVAGAGHATQVLKGKPDDASGDVPPES